MRHTLGVGLSITGQRQVSGLGPPPPIAEDATTSGGTNGATSLTVTLPVAVTSGYGIVTARIFLLDPTGGIPSVTGVTYAGRAMTRLAGSQKTLTLLGQIETWYLTNPPAGTADVVASFDVSCIASLIATSHDGVSRVTPFGTPVVNNGTGTTASCTITATAGNILLSHVAAYGTTANVSITATGNIASDGSVAAGLSPNRTRHAGGEDVGESGSVAQTYTISQIKTWAEAVFELKAA